MKLVIAVLCFQQLLSDSSDLKKAKIDLPKNFNSEKNDRDLDSLIADKLEKLNFQTPKESVDDFSERLIAWSNDLIINESDTVRQGSRILARNDRSNLQTVVHRQILEPHA